MDNKFSKTAGTGRVLGSWLGLKLLAVPLFAAILIGGVVLTDLRADVEAPDVFACRTAQRWAQQYGQAAGRLRVLRVDVLFPGRRGSFDAGEGVVIAPVGLDLDGLQKVVAVASSPVGLGRVRFEGVVNQVWEYAASLHRDLRYTALTLVRPVRASFESKDSRSGAFDSLGIPTLDFVRSDVMYEAGLTASETSEHSLGQCEEFAVWAANAARWGDPSRRFLSLAQKVGTGIEDGEEGGRRSERICTAVREGRFSPHQAQVALVMGARETGLPAFALAGAQPGLEYLAAVWAGARGWRVVNVKDPAAGYLVDLPALVSKAPVLGRFPASDHDFWWPTATAYSPTLNDGRYAVLSHTDWASEQAASEPRVPVTRVRTMRLSEVCR